MIQLSKNGEPPILSANKATWTAELMDYIQRGEKVPSSVSNRYNNPEVKESLRKESNSKCIYCESNVQHITYEHIEHLKPKAKDKYPELTFEYENLGLSCPKCNMNKGSEYDENLPYLNPFVDNPENHFKAVGALIWALPGDRRAKLTEIDIELNRPELLEVRLERLNSIRSLVEIYNQETNPRLKQSLKKEIETEISEDKPYSFVASKLVEALLN